MQDKIRTSEIRIGDILYVHSINACGFIIGSRPFVVWDKNPSSPTEIMLYEISGQPKTGDEYPYNIPVVKSEENGLTLDSHIKADQLYIYCENILKAHVIKLGSLEKPYMQGIKERSEIAQKAKEHFLYDQSNNGKKIRF